jgi:hypothetical protein
MHNDVVFKMMYNNREVNREQNGWNVQKRKGCLGTIGEHLTEHTCNKKSMHEINEREVQTQKVKEVS